MDGTFSRLELLGKLLDVANLRHRVIAQNIANIDTPGYQRLEVAFEDAFAQKLAAPGGTAALLVQPQVVLGAGESERVDGNNVDLEAELGRLTKNSLLMNAFTQIIASRVAAQRAAIAGR
jgi:flagellar basal-body rod protein FlgB